MLPFAGFCWKTIKPCLPRKKTRVKLPQLKVAPKETESRAENQARSSVLSLEKSFLAKISQLSCRLWCRCLCRSADSLAAVSPQGRLPLYPQWKVGGLDLNLISSCFLGVGGTCTGTSLLFFPSTRRWRPSSAIIKYSFQKRPSLKQGNMVGRIKEICMRIYKKYILQLNNHQAERTRESNDKTTAASLQHRTSSFRAAETPWTKVSKRKVKDKLPSPSKRHGESFSVLPSSFGHYDFHLA